MDTKLSETTNLCVEIMNSKRQVKGKLGHVVQNRVCCKNIYIYQGNYRQQQKSKKKDWIDTVSLQG